MHFYRKAFEILIGRLKIKKMEYSYIINDVHRTVLVTVSGELYANDFAKLNIEVCSMALKLNYKLIFDFTNAVVRIGLGEAYFWFSDHLDKINTSFRRIPTAHIANDLNEPFFRFVEVAWTNRGSRTKMFREVERALEWLDQLDKASVSG
jgi:hypothetical protein